VTQPAIRVLLVEDVATEAELEVRELKRAGLPVKHRLVDSEETLLEALREFAPDVILSDFSMPHFDGMAALAVAREHAPEVPFIFVSGTIGEEYAIRALKNGAMDYVLKTNLVRLPAAVERAVEIAAERKAQRRAQGELDRQQERIRHLAFYDQLTGLPNRTFFHELLAGAIREPRHDRSCLALVLLDLERFKAINDTLGQQIGDGVLVAVARWLLQLAGDANRVARLGADQFALLFHAVADAEEARRRLEDSATAFFSAPVEVRGNEVRLAAKAGIALFPGDGREPAALFQNAEAALKRAKETGERYLFYTPEINAWVAERVELENRLRKAVENGELFFHYQPKYDLASRRIVGLEALMRWNGPGGDPVPPVKFVPILEQTGLILEAGRQALAAASALFRRWQARGLNPPRIAVNVSALQLRRQSFVADVRSALGDIGPDGGGVDLEITESLLMTDVTRSIQKLAELRGMGLKVALDDFGTGYSSLAYLSMLPLDALKIDRGFVRGMMGKRVDASIITTIISLAQALRLKVVAEGVETEEQAMLLHELGCDQAQGFLLSRPRPEHEIELLLPTG
jgi:diguanylate cyclase